MRISPRMVACVLLAVFPLACTEAPRFMKEEQKSGVVIFAGQFAQGSMFRDNDAPASAYTSEMPNVAASPATVAARPAAPTLAQRTPRPKPIVVTAKKYAAPTPI